MAADNLFVILVFFDDDEDVVVGGERRSLGVGEEARQEDEGEA